MPAAARAAVQEAPALAAKPRSSDLLVILPTLRSSRRPLPKHDYADKHHVLLAFKKYSSAERIKSAKKSFLASGEIACARVREFAYDLGAEVEWAYGWKAKAAARLGLGYSTMWNILTEHITSISTRTVDRVAAVSGVPVWVFYDNEA